MNPFQGFRKGKKHPELTFKVGHSLTFRFSMTHTHAKMGFLFLLAVGRKSCEPKGLLESEKLSKLEVSPDHQQYHSLRKAAAGFSHHVDHKQRGRLEKEADVTFKARPLLPRI